MSSTDLFQTIDTLPDPRAQERYEALVGLENVKARLEKEAELLLNPEELRRWSNEHHKRDEIAAARALQNRTSLFVFAGDVGTGKTVLAETFADAVARRLKIEIVLFQLSLSARGSGAVGEMTRLLAEAFAEVETHIAPVKSGKRVERGGVLLIDEADALAQSRELAQMHHEDRAGVNALIRGIDHLAVSQRPVLTVMATNRLSALDPAVRRRAAGIFEFERPNEEQRITLLDALLSDAGLEPDQIKSLAHLTGRDGREYGFTFSDIVNRVVPAAVLAAFPDSPITFEILVEAIADNPPTPPFATHAG